MTNNVDENSGTGVLKRLCDVMSADEFKELLERCHAAARARGAVFFYDETGQLMGQRYQATYFRGLAQAVHMDELAARLDPAEFAPGAFEQLQAQIVRDGRKRAAYTLLPACPAARPWPVKRSRRARHQAR